MMATKTLSRIILVRHGITDWIEQGILHGISDRPLSKIGLKQAQEVGGALRNTSAKKLYTSPLSRAFQTAEAISKETGLKLETVNELHEMDYGWMEGKRDLWKYYKHRKLIIKLYRSARLFSGLVSGESKSRFRKRVLSAWEDIKTEHPGEDKIVVAHFGVIHAIMMHEFEGSIEDTKKFVFYPCSITEIELNGSKPARLIRLNDAEHISAGLDA